MIEPGDDALVLAESLGTLAPLKMNKRAFEVVREPAPEHLHVEERAGA